MQRFLERRHDFQEFLITLLHITGGQPGRATELAALTWADQANGAFRMECSLVDRVGCRCDRP